MAPAVNSGLHHQILPLALVGLEGNGNPGLISALARSLGNPEILQQAPEAYCCLHIAMLPGRSIFPSWNEWQLDPGL